MSDIETNKKLINDTLDEIITYETLKNNDLLVIFGMIAERLNCVCIDEDSLDYLYINNRGEIEDGDDIFDRVVQIACKYGFIDRVKKCWKATV
jgi:hypothetical protein